MVIAETFYSVKKLEITYMRCLGVFIIGIFIKYTKNLCRKWQSSTLSFTEFVRKASEVIKMKNLAVRHLKKTAKLLNSKQILEVKNV